LILKALKVTVKHLAGHRMPVPLRCRKALTGVANKRPRYGVCATLPRPRKPERGWRCPGRGSASATARGNNAGGRSQTQPGSLSGHSCGRQSSLPGDHAPSSKASAPGRPRRARAPAPSPAARHPCPRERALPKLHSNPRASSIAHSTTVPSAARDSAVPALR